MSFQLLSANQREYFIRKLSLPFQCSFIYILLTYSKITSMPIVTNCFYRPVLYAVQWLLVERPWWIIYVFYLNICHHSSLEPVQHCNCNVFQYSDSIIWYLEICSLVSHICCLGSTLNSCDGEVQDWVGNYTLSTVIFYFWTIHIIYCACKTLAVQMWSEWI